MTKLVLAGIKDLWGPIVLCENVMKFNADRMGKYAKNKWKPKKLFQESF